MDHAQGCDVKCENDSGFAEAVAMAKNAAALVFVVGLDQSPGEVHDPIQECYSVHCALYTLCIVLTCNYWHIVVIVVSVIVNILVSACFNAYLHT